jgi:hypothetical protein
MSYVYVGTRNANNTENVINEVFVAATEESVLNQMVPFITEPLNSFIEDNIDDVENIVEMLYNNEEDKDDAFDEKVASLQNLSVEEVVQLFSPKELLTIYANLYQEEEVISLAGYNEDGEKEIVVLSNESDD